MADVGDTPSFCKYYQEDTHRRSDNLCSHTGSYVTFTRDLLVLSMHFGETGCDGLAS